jgi:AbrB family looped-hinge helix DNA binding protein
MTVVHMSEKGQIVVPKEIRDRHGFANGSVFAVVETRSGNVVLRPVKTRPGKDLLDWLKEFRDIEIPERKHFCKPRA